MKNIINCLINHNPVITKKLKEVSIEEGRVIATELFQILNKRQDGVGLAANQVGIDASVAVVNVKEPIVLINPKIVRKEEETRYYEGCLSFPKKGCHTKRYKIVEVEVDNYESNLTFGAGDTEVDLLESVCVQHEIDHLNGMRILDRVVKRKATYGDVELLSDVTKQIEGHTICAFGEGSAWPVQGLLRHFRKEVESRCREEPLIKKKLNNPYLVDQHLLENKNA